MSEKLVEEWLDKAEEDYQSLQILFKKSPSDFATTICFHSQQCAEKYLKATLIKHCIEPPWIHTLETLLDLIIPEVPELEEYREMLAQLTPYATEYRYPGKVANKDDAKTCVDIITKFQKNIKSFLED
jgi:HEPN domain-containing protein